MYPPLNRSRRAAAGSLTAQYGSSINQRHFQCPITETPLLGLSEADSSPIHLLGEGREGRKGRWGKKSHCGTPVAFTCSNGGLLRAQEDPSEIVFSRSGKQQKKGKLLVSGNTQGGWCLLAAAGMCAFERGQAGGRVVAAAAEEVEVGDRISGWRCVC